MQFTVAEWASLILAVSGLLTAILSGRKSRAEGADLYAKAAQAAVNAQAELQEQIDTLRERLDRKDKRIDELERQVRELTELLQQKDARIQELEKLTHEQAQEIEQLRKKVEALRKLKH